jgi:hypothetical protein
MNRTEFQSEYNRLTRAFESDQPSVACIGSTNVRASSHCMFSHDLTRCHRCTHCTGCTDCTGLSHSRGCESCHESAYLLDCTGCSKSAYLVQCLGCTDCTYCFGCVGIAKKDFHILNQPYSRDAYFKLTKALRRELGLEGRG